MKSGLLVVVLSAGLVATGSTAWTQGLEGPENLGVRVPLLLSSTFLTAVNTIELTTGDGSRILGLLGVLSGAASIWAETESTDGKAWVWSVGVASLLTGALNLWRGESEQSAAAKMMGNITPIVLGSCGVTPQAGVMTIVHF